MKDLVAEIAKVLVNKPEKVIVNEVKGDRTVVLELHTAKRDVGQVIGKGGQRAAAIRNILDSVSAKEKRQYLLEIIDPHHWRQN